MQFAKTFVATVLLGATYVYANDAKIKEAKAAISDDPVAVFEGVYMGKTGTGYPVVCGTINERNASGAFSGRKRFFYLDRETFAVLDKDSGAVAEGMFEMSCLNSAKEQMPSRSSTSSSSAHREMAPPASSRCTPPYYVTVRKGVSLTDIATEAGQSWRDIVRWNDLTAPNEIAAGQTLRVQPPECGPSPATAVEGAKKPPTNRNPPAPAAGSAHALSDADCDAMHTLVDHTFLNLDKLMGSQLETELGMAIYRVSRPARPFERCEIYELEEDKPARSRLLTCDLTAQSGIEPIAGTQSEFSAAVFVKTTQSIADDYAKCFFKRATGPETKAAKDGRVVTRWLWSLTLDAAPAYFAAVALELKQAGVGQEIGTPQITMRFRRSSRNATEAK